MSEQQGDLARDLRLADALGRLPAPAMPAGLADRIARNATSLPQLHEPIEIAETAVEPSAPAVEAEPRRIRRWLAYAAAGAAIAASFAVVLLQTPGKPERPPAAPLVAQNRPVAPPRALLRALAEAQEATGAATVPPLKPVAGAKTGRATREPRDGASHLVKDGSSNAPPVVAPLEAPPPAVAVTAPEAKPSGPANMGPPDLDDFGTPMPRQGGGAEFGITGTSGPDLPNPSPAPRGQSNGRGSQGMPHF